uniref:Uncharacterized protein n=1 Tax=viral metagenome TaxID=1070528 RepID=A0A6C0L6R9_9ZZZZ
MIHAFELMTNDLFAVGLFEIQVEGMVPYLRVARRVRIGIHVGQFVVSAESINFIFANGEALSLCLDLHEPQYQGLVKAASNMQACSQEGGGALLKRGVG